MAYSLKLVEFDNANLHLFTGSPGIFPSGPIPYFLHSSWHCSPPDSSNGALTVGSEVTVTVRNNPNTLPPTVRLQFFNDGGASSVTIFDAYYALPANLQWHVLFSVSCPTKTVQVYVNDAPATLISGGWSASMDIQHSNFFQTMDITASSSGAIWPAVADFWESATPSFVDLSQTSNRRKFIASDLTAVDLGANGAGPLGFSPSVFLTAPSSASQFPHNYGTGGTFTVNVGSLAYQTPGTCPVPNPPPPGPPPVPPTPPTVPTIPYMRERTYRHRFLGRSFEPTLVITKDRPGPLRIVELDMWID